MTEKKNAHGHDLTDFFPPIQFNEVEKALDRIEEAWADCVAGFRPDAYRRIRRDGKTSIRCLGIIAVHELLENHRKDFEAGDASALYDALKCCLEENLPAPAWLASALLRTMQKVDDEPGLSLHSALMLDKRYPLTKIKSHTARWNWQTAVELWGLVRVHQKENDSSLDAAIKAVRKAHPRIGKAFSQRKATYAFHEVDRIQSRAIRTIQHSR